jgi:predicted nucleic acid-binding protein
LTPFFACSRASTKGRTALELVAKFPILPNTKEAEKLASHYIRHGAIPEKHINDALHLAIATVHNVDYLVSWNFRHLVNVRTIKQVQAINMLYGYPVIQIIAPPESQ